MDAKRCDRCGDFYTERPANALENVAQALAQMAEAVSPCVCKSKEQQLIEMVIDLCPKCSKSLNNWLHGKEKEFDGH